MSLVPLCKAVALKFEQGIYKATGFAQDISVESQVGACSSSGGGSSSSRPTPIPSSGGIKPSNPLYPARLQCDWTCTNSLQLPPCSKCDPTWMGRRAGWTKSSGRKWSCSSCTEADPAEVEKSRARAKEQLCDSCLAWIDNVETVPRAPPGPPALPFPEPIPPEPIPPGPIPPQPIPFQLKTPGRFEHTDRFRQPPLSTKAMDMTYSKGLLILKNIAKARARSTRTQFDLQAYLQSQLPVIIDARAPFDKRCIKAKSEEFVPKQVFSAQERAMLARGEVPLLLPVPFVHASATLEPGQLVAPNLHEHLDMKPGQIPYRWSVQEARAKQQALKDSGPTRIAGGAYQLDIFTWSSGESRGMHAFDDFRTGAWVVGLAQEADDPKEPDSDDSDDSHEMDTDEGDKIDPRGKIWPFWSPPEWAAQFSNKRRWGRIDDKKIRQPRHGFDISPCYMWSDYDTQETRAHTRQPLISKGYTYDQVAYIENLGYKVVCKNGNMVYAKSHACTDIKVLDSDTIRSQANANKWDMRQP